MSSEPSSMSVVDVTLRDGLQNNTAELSTTDKAALLRRLASAGVRRAEVTSFVSPTAVPKMADAEALLDLIRTSEEPVEVSCIGLIVNARGFERAARAGVDEVNVVVLATDTFNRRNQGMDTADSLRELGPLVEAARGAHLRVSITIGAAFGCPFEGPVPLGRLADVVGAVAATAPDEIALADTIGVAVPHEITERLAAAQRAAGPGPEWRLHLHNTRNTGYANAMAGVAAGVGALDASVGGIGGCPFAPAATGNIATEDLSYLLERSGVASGLDLPSLISAADWLAERLDHAVPGLLAKAGVWPAGDLQ